MSEPILTVLKFFLLALIWLFFLRVLRVQWVDLRARQVGDPALVPPAPVRPRPAPPTPAPPRPAAPAPVAPPGRYTLTAVDGPDRRSIAIDREMTVGRAGGADIPLPGDSFASSRHARLWVDAGLLWVEDLGSTNGTQVNGRAVASATRLDPGDRVQVGRTVFEVAGA